MKSVLGMTSSHVPEMPPGRRICGLYGKLVDRVVARCRLEAISSLRLPQATIGCSCRQAFRSRSLLFATLGADPLFDPLMWNPLAAIERSHGSLNAGHLPLVQLQVLVYRLSSEERFGSTRYCLASFSSRFLMTGSMRTLTVVEDMFNTLCVQLGDSERGEDDVEPLDFAQF